MCKGICHIIERIESKALSASNCKCFGKQKRENEKTRMSCPFNFAVITACGTQNGTREAGTEENEESNIVEVEGNEEIIIYNGRPNINLLSFCFAPYLGASSIPSSYQVHVLFDTFVGCFTFFLSHTGFPSLLSWSDVFAVLLNRHEIPLFVVLFCLFPFTDSEDFICGPIWYLNDVSINRLRLCRCASWFSYIFSKWWTKTPHFHQIWGHN